MIFRRRRSRKIANVDSLFNMPKLVMESRETDPQGSYTGAPVDGGEPVQDADDL